MKIIIVSQDNLDEDEIIIKCRKIDDNIHKIQKSIQDITENTLKISLYKEDKEYYIPINQILFFETGIRCVYAHTSNDMFNIRYKLYELEEILPNNFFRVSKSTILNTNHVFSISRNLTSSNLVQFYKSHKQVYVSRYYYKMLKDKLKSRKEKL